METHKVLGVRLDYAPQDIMYDKMIELAQKQQSSYCCVPNVHQCVEAYHDSEHRAILENADLVFSDSVILSRARDLKYRLGMHRIPKGSEMLRDLCKLCESEGLSVGFYGATSDTLRKLSNNMRARFPDLKISYVYSPPFRELTDVEAKEVVEAVNLARVNLLFVGLGCPKQEHWMAIQRGKVSAAMIGVGAAFDFNAGNVKESPKWIHVLGLEWLWRLLREPKRLFKRYITTSPKFILLYLWHEILGRPLKDA